MFLRINMQPIVLTSLIIVFSCKSQNHNYTNKTLTKDVPCPNYGKCDFKVFENQSIVFKKDAFGNGYAEFIDKDAVLLKFEYKRNETENTVDGQYIERVYIELPLNPTTLFLKNQELETVNVLFERVCYCKGQTGFYKIDQGTLSLKPLKKNSYHLQLNFKTSEVPQIITEIDEVFSLKEN